MATNLQFITSSSCTNVETISITDCFSSSYDVYLIILDVFDVSSTFDNSELKEENNMVSKTDTFKLMKEKNPQEFRKIKSAMLVEQSVQQEPIMQEEGFIDMEGA